METNRVIFLGTGDAFSAGGRYQAAYLIQSAGSSMLLDCGPGTLGSLKRHDLPVASTDTVLLSHFHGDHFAGLPFLFLQFAIVEPRTKPLRIVGPPEVEQRVMLLFQAMYADSAAAQLPFKLQFIEARPGKDLVLDGVKIDPFVVPHQKHPQSYGYEIRSGARKIVYSGDTGWTEDLLVHSEDADLFICECSFFETRMETHLDYPRIAENLERFGSKRMVLTHLGHEVLKRSGEIDMELGKDGLVVTL
jgi:ribonuclease BN (tRNA processing enzyme)